ncbi:MAG: hypothetical protein H6842_00870 [Rhodospirillaceae bacterium]|nr:hypothetical protein [Rhodospirillaceae bacterium]
MANPPRSRRRARSALSTQMVQVSAEGRERIERHWIGRILGMLSDDALILAAARTTDPTEGMHLECGFADKIWSHGDVQARVRQLAERGVKVELVQHESEIAGRHFTRPMLFVRIAR